MENENVGKLRKMFWDLDPKGGKTDAYFSVSSYEPETKTVSSFMVVISMDIIVWRIVQKEMDTCILEMRRDIWWDEIRYTADS